ncbi:MAG: SurA N-terminal domain-containing protein [Rhizobiaceae bacterium]|nr:SurA N-terminal domain-containing protein [Rhizobiaceae bacterium]
MLDFLRRGSTGWLAKILIGLLVLSFAIWGISGSIIFGNQNTVAQVGDTKVSTLDYRLAYENQLLALSQQVGRRLTQQQADAFGLRQNVLNQVVAGAVLDENTRKMGLGVSEEELAKAIAADPTFRDLSGNFSRSALTATLRQYGLSEQEYIQSRKLVAMRNQLQDGTAASLALPTAFADALSNFQNEERVFEYVEFGAEVVEEKPVPSEADIEAYYEDNKSRFVAPEYRKVNVLQIEAAKLVKPDEVTDEDLRAEYENRQSNLTTPERRRVEQLVLANAEEAATVSAELKLGKSFEDVVTGLGKKVEDLSLGLVSAGELPDKSVSDGAFAATLNQPTDVIEGVFGPVIVRVTEIEQERTTTFDEIKDQLRNEIALRVAGDSIFETYDLVEEERGAGETLKQIADKFELEYRVVDAMDNRGENKAGVVVPGISNPRNLARAVFASSVDEDNDPLEIGSDGFVWFEVAEVIPERQKPLDEVREDVSASWISDETNNQSKAIADKIAERVSNGEDFNAVIAEELPSDSLGAAVTFSTSDAVSRSAQTSNLSRGIIEAGFEAKVGDVTTASTGTETFAVLRVKSAETKDGSNLPTEQLENLNALATQDMVGQFVQDLQSRESVSINQSAIDAAFNPYAGGGHGG